MPGDKRFPGTISARAACNIGQTLDEDNDCAAVTIGPVDVAAAVVVAGVHEGHPHVKCTTTVGVQSSVTVSEGYGFWVGSPGRQVLVGCGQTYRRCFLFLQTIPKKGRAVVVTVSAAMLVHDDDSDEEAEEEDEVVGRASWKVGTSPVPGVG
ncbi:hypothetical protein PG996_008286 [Apiospora saccharicola]|uniref:Uncharacterized protein n=1 Tax=Apiospora saccharicola TaxID=335842 RepID=A0ABR1V0N2_9PEZI